MTAAPDWLNVKFPVGPILVGIAGPLAPGTDSVSCSGKTESAGRWCEETLSGYRAPGTELAGESIDSWALSGPETERSDIFQWNLKLGALGRGVMAVAGQE